MIAISAVWSNDWKTNKAVNVRPTRKSGEGEEKDREDRGGRGGGGGWYAAGEEICTFAK